MNDGRSTAQITGKNDKNTQFTEMEVDSKAEVAVIL